LFKFFFCISSSAFGVVDNQILQTTVNQISQLQKQVDETLSSTNAVSPVPTNAIAEEEKKSLLKIPDSLASVYSFKSSAPLVPVSGQSIAPAPPTTAQVAPPTSAQVAPTSSNLVQSKIDRNTQSSIQSNARVDESLSLTLNETQKDGSYLSDSYTYMDADDETTLVSPELVDQASSIKNGELSGETSATQLEDANKAKISEMRERLVKKYSQYSELLNDMNTIPIETTIEQLSNFERQADEAIRNKQSSNDIPKIPNYLDELNGGNKTRKLKYKKSNKKNIKKTKHRK